MLSNQSPCPDDDTLRLFLEAELPPEQSAEVDAHVSTCRDCEQTVARIAGGSGDGFALPFAALVVSTRATATAIDPAELQLPGLEVQEILGRGGMGIVYRVFDPVLKRELALKTVLPDFAENDRATQRFRDEALITGQLQHPGIPPVHSMGTMPDGRPCLLMKLINGQTLTEAMSGESSRALDREILLGYFEQICQTMAYAHERGVIHRDLKPQNIMLGAFGAVQIMDWGLAKVLLDSSLSPEMLPELQREGTPVRVESDGPLTQHGAVVGTYAYMPPEQAQGLLDQISRPADVFALGAVLCAILTGRPPYEGADRNDVRRQAETWDIAAALKRLADCGADREWIVLAEVCLSQRPEERPQSASEVVSCISQIRRTAEARRKQAELDLATAHVEQEKATAIAREERRRRKLQMMFGLSAAVLLGLATFGFWSAHERAQERETDRLLATARANAEISATLQELELQLSSSMSSTHDIRERLAQVTAQLADSNFPDLIVRRDHLAFELQMAELLDDIEDRSWLDESRITDVMPSVTDEYTQAFLQYGISVSSETPTEVSQKISVSLISERLTSGLYRWMRSSGDEEDRIVAVLNELDPRPAHCLMRLAIADGDAGTARQAITSLDYGTLTPEFGELIVARELLMRKDSQRLSAILLDRYPRNFGLAMTAGDRTLKGTTSGRELARNYYRIAASARPTSVAALVQIGEMSHQLREYDAAESAYRKAIDLNPASGVAHAGLAKALDSQGNLAEAVNTLNTLASKLWPNQSNAHNYLGMHQLQVKDFQSAAKSFRQALALDPQSMYAHYGLGVALVGLGDSDGALLSVNREIDLNPQNPAAYYLRGQIFAEQGDYDLAARDYHSVLRLKPDDADAVHALGDIYAAKKEWARAADLYRQSKSSDASDARVFLELGKMLLTEQHDVPGAIAAFKESLHLDNTVADAHYSLAVALADLSDVPQAINEYREAIGLEPKMYSAHINLGLLYLKQEKLESAIDEWTQVTELVPDDATPHYLLGLVAGLRNDPVQAERHFRRSIELDAEHPDSYRELGKLLAARKDSDSAIAALETAVCLDPDDTDAWTVLAEQLAESGDADGAIEAFQEAVRLDPTDPDSLQRLAALLKTTEARTEAIACYRALVKLSPNDHEPAFELGVLLQAEGDFAAAVNAYQAVLELIPDDSNVRINLALALAANDQPVEAEEAYRECIRRHPENSTAYTYLGSFLQDQNRSDDALVAYRKAIELAPEDSEPHYNMGTLLHELKDFSGAISAYRQAITLAPEDPRSYVNLGVALEDSGDFEGAVTALRDALVAFPSELYGHTNLGRIYASRGEIDAAIREYELAVALDADDGSLQFYLGRLLCLAKKWDAALPHLRRATELEPLEIDGFIELGACLTRLDEYESALDAFNQALALKANHAEALLGRGEALLKTGATAAAVEDFSAVIQLRSRKVDSAQIIRAVHQLEVAGEAMFALELLQSRIEAKPDSQQDVRFERVCLACRIAERPETDRDAEFSPSRLRQQALSDLEKEFARLKKAAEIEREQLAVLATLNRWLSEPDLESVRDVSRLTLSERDSWDFFWTDVRQLQKTLNATASSPQ